MPPHKVTQAPIGCSAVHSPGEICAKMRLGLRQLLL